MKGEETKDCCQQCEYFSEQEDDFLWCNSFAKCKKTQGTAYRNDKK